MLYEVPPSGVAFNARSGGAIGNHIDKNVYGGHKNPTDSIFAIDRCKDGNQLQIPTNLRAHTGEIKWRRICAEIEALRSSE